MAIRSVINFGASPSIALNVKVGILKSTLNFIGSQ